MTPSTSRKMFSSLTFKLFLLALCAADNPTEVKSKSGVLRGRKMTVLDGKEVYSFLGVPYAAPPTGSGRFAPPKDVEPWAGVLDAYHLPRPCFQVIPEQLGSSIFFSKQEETEDCLKLNIWVPKHRPKKSAVMIFIHGGAFGVGSSDIVVYDGSTLAAQENVIVASLNYRLSAFGFLYLNHPGAPGNVGLMDQAAALKWIHRNAKYFGGDPDRITIFGESAGAVSVGHHLLAPTSLEYFRNAILQSGSPAAHFGAAEPGEALEHGLQLAAFAGCPVEEEMRGETILCLQKLGADDLRKLALKVKDKLLKMPFRPVIDGSYLPSSPSDILSRGKVCRTKNVMVSFTSEDGSFLLPFWFSDFEMKEDSVYTQEQLKRVIAETTYNVEQPTPLESEVIEHLYTDWDNADDKYSVRREVVRFLTDRWFRCPALSLANILADQGNNVYLFSFDQIPEIREGQPPLPRWMGSGHCDDLYFMLGRKLIQDPPATSEEIKVANQMMRYFANFARKDDPNDELLPLWPKYSTKEKLCLHIDGKGTTAKKTGQLRECHFWDHTFPKIKIAPKDEL